MRAICGAAYLSQEFAKQIQLVRAEVNVTSNPSLLRCDQLLRDYIYDKPKRRSPSYVRHHGSSELRDRLKWLEPRNKHNVRHRVQIAHVVREEQNGDKEFSQIDLI